MFPALHKISWIMLIGAYWEELWKGQRGFDKTWLGLDYSQLLLCTLAVLIFFILESKASTQPIGLKGSWNKGGKGAAALSIFLNYSIRDPFLPHQYSGNLVVCPTNIWDLPTPLMLILNFYVFCLPINVLNMHHISLK